MHKGKIVLAGSAGAGKTTLVFRIQDDQFIQDIPSTVNSSYYEKRIIKNDQKHSLYIWDTAGQEKFRSITSIYFRNTHIGLLVFNVQSIESYNEIRFWYSQFKQKSGCDSILYLIASKCDEARKVASEDGERLAQELGMKYFETSSKTGQGVDVLIDDLIETVVSYKKQEKEEQLQFKDKEKSGDCC
uniref:Rab-like protein n=1 Tax=Trepomonas sp. PC1 TaxID=1076344 RepID=A0A146KMR0_9EUKA|eukprot:JAP96591.1 Rab-like protein [Trepomonas sp. PC1]